MKTGITINDHMLNTIRQNRFLTWTELAREAGITSSTLFSVKAGRRRASLTTLRKIAKALDVDPSTLVQQ